MQALEETAGYVTENMAPVCDYSSIFQEYEEGKYINEVKLSTRQTFRKTVRRVIALNIRK
jgi:hypothetical protein